jgi:hypothetical protein
METKKYKCFFFGELERAAKVRELLEPLSIELITLKYFAIESLERGETGFLIQPERIYEAKPLALIVGSLLQGLRLIQNFRKYETRLENGLPIPIFVVTAANLNEFTYMQKLELKNLNIDKDHFFNWPDVHIVDEVRKKFITAIEDRINMEAKKHKIFLFDDEGSERVVKLQEILKSLPIELLTIGYFTISSLQREETGVLVTPEQIVAEKPIALIVDLNLVISAGQSPSQGITLINNFREYERKNGISIMPIFILTSFHWGEIPLEHKRIKALKIREEQFFK